MVEKEGGREGRNGGRGLGFPSSFSLVSLVSVCLVCGSRRWKAEERWRRGREERTGRGTGKRGAAMELREAQRWRIRVSEEERRLIEQLRTDEEEDDDEDEEEEEDDDDGSFSKWDGFTPVRDVSSDVALPPPTCRSTWSSPR
jgi:hypothetical protein